MRLIPRLLELQKSHGYLTDELLRQVARDARVPLYRIQGLVSFYPHFRMSPPPKTEIAVCRDMACWLKEPAAAKRVRDHFSGNPEILVRETSCLGRCEMAPAALVNELPKTVAAACGEAAPATPKVTPRPWRCDPYSTEAEHYALLRELLTTPRIETADRLIATLKDSGLRGMGGAGFPAAAKWEFVRNQSRTPKYLICNADESEPGTFKDREILASLSHLVIEGMILGALAVGASQAILFIRHEYEPERHAFETELGRARNSGLLQQAGVEIEVFVSPGGYILGEETALLECLEDKRGEPRNKPPFPGSHGLHGQPTLINNVETLAMVPAIVRNGADWWKAQGKPGFVGLKVMAVSGDIARPGVYEIPVGTTVRELIEQAGGISEGKPLLAFLPGGASSNFLPAGAADTPIDFNALAKAGSMLGSGALFVVAEGADLLALATNIARFFRNESCGKCVPCRVGSQKAVELLDDIHSDRRSRAELRVLPELGETLAQTSICGLGQVALNPVLSVIKQWHLIPDEAQVSNEKQLVEHKAERRKKLNETHYIEAPNEYSGGATSLFLAGGITGTRDWQATVAHQLSGLPLVILNPRRRDFSSSDPTAAEEQIAWEFRHLRKAAAVLFWFSPETLCPIALFELGGRAASSQPLFVGTHPEYERKLDVEIQLRLARPEVKIVHELSELVFQVRVWFQSLGK
jgi:NADH:ubiquinone oxidoreductase subunit F (NADH-binding)